MSTLKKKSTNDLHIPFAERMRPQSLDKVVGQEKLLAKEDNSMGQGSLRICLDGGVVPSMILWGPPGTGKTTIARLIVQFLPNYEFINISAVSSGVNDLKKVCSQAQESRKLKISTCLFIDEIHRFNKSQQDYLLHYVEEGIIILIGATTENPSFALNSALLSRMQVFVLEALSSDSLQKIFYHAEQQLQYHFDIEDTVLQSIFYQVDGDARRLLNIVEQLYVFQTKYHHTITSDNIKQILLHVPLQYDKVGGQHYNLSSALHKSIRGSDCDAALYWFARMCRGGENPHYIARRLLRLSYEDIGLADLMAPQYVLQAWQTYERLGSPEGELALASAVIYLSLSPKSNRSYSAFNEAMHSAKYNQSKTPPAHILNAPTKLMKDIGYGEGYIYDHTTSEGISGQNYFPDDMQRESYYQPVERGFEREMQKRLEYFKKLRNKQEK